MTTTDPATSAATDPAPDAPAGHAPGDAVAPGTHDVVGGPPFGPEFFATVLADRVRAECQGRPEQVPVVELHLLNGTLDLCHIPGVMPHWMAAYGYRDRETCEEMDLHFIPYGLVTRVTISLWHRSQRPIGFQLGEANHAGGA